MPRTAKEEETKAKDEKGQILELAAQVGTTASDTSRLEDADYEGHSMAMLRRIAAAIGKRVEARLVSID